MSSNNGLRSRSKISTSSTISKSKVSDRKSKKPSFIPLRQANVGYLELHRMHATSKNSSVSKLGKNASSSIAESQLLQPPSASPSLEEEPFVFRKDANTDIKLSTPPQSESQLDISSSNKSIERTGTIKRNLRSVHSSTIKVNKFFQDSLTNISLEGSRSESCRSSQLNLSRHKLHCTTCSSISTQLLEYDKSKSSSSTFLLNAFARKIGEVASRSRGLFLCPICNEPLTNPAIISCGHVFCMRCVCSWFEGQENCPCCRHHITGKDITDDTVLAREFAEVSPILAAVFNAGNFYASIKHEIELLSDDIDYAPASPTSRPLHSCPTSAKIFSKIIAPISRRIFDESDENLKRIHKIKGHGDINENYRCNALAAIWFLRQSLLLQRAYHEKDDSEEDSFPSQIPFFIRLETERGTEASRELLLKRVMQMKLPSSENNCTNFTIPCNSLASIFSTRKLLAGRVNFLTQRRLRLPTLHSLGKILTLILIYLLFFLSVHFFDDHDKATKAISQQIIGIDLCKLDFVVYTVVVYFMVSLTETDRMTYLRRRAAERNRRRRRANDLVNGGGGGRRGDPLDIFIFT